MPVAPVAAPPRLNTIDLGNADEMITLLLLLIVVLLLAGGGLGYGRRRRL